MSGELTTPSALIWDVRRSELWGTGHRGRSPPRSAAGLPALGEDDRKAQQSREGTMRGKKTCEECRLTGRVHTHNQTLPWLGNTQTHTHTERVWQARVHCGAVTLNEQTREGSLDGGLRAIPVSAVSSPPVARETAIVHSWVILARVSIGQLSSLRLGLRTYVNNRGEAGSSRLLFTSYHVV